MGYPQHLLHILEIVEQLMVQFKTIIHTHSYLIMD